MDPEADELLRDLERREGIAGRREIPVPDFMDADDATEYLGDGGKEASYGYGEPPGGSVTPPPSVQPWSRAIRERSGTGDKGVAPSTRRFPNEGSRHGRRQSEGPLLDGPPLREPATDDDCRTPWYRDYGRVVHSASFRRLQAKTRILGVGEGDFHRTRLTHTLEVSQTGESIRNRLHRDHGGNDSDDIGKWLPDSALIRAICLTHDLGHPPFGHDGEVALNRCMLGEGGFEGNGQTLRTVLGAVKYPAPHNAVSNGEAYPDHRRGLSGEPVFGAAGFEPPKRYPDDGRGDVVRGWLANGLDEWGRFSKFEERQGKHHKTEHKSLDASIMELADDIAYGVHDLEDAISLGIIDRRTFREWFEECGRRSAVEPLLDAPKVGPGFEVLVDRPFSRQTHERKQVIGRLVGAFVGAVKVIPDRQFQTPLFKHQASLAYPEKARAPETLQRIAGDRVIECVEVQRLRFRGQRMVTELFHAFATDPKRLLDGRDHRRSTDGGGDTPIERVVCDHIAGMTDDHAVGRYRQLFVPGAGSVFDRLLAAERERLETVRTPARDHHPPANRDGDQKNGLCAGMTS